MFHSDKPKTEKQQQSEGEIRVWRRKPVEETNPKQVHFHFPVCQSEKEFRVRVKNENASNNR